MKITLPKIIRLLLALAGLLHRGQRTRNRASGFRCPQRTFGCPTGQRGGAAPQWDSQQVEEERKAVLGAVFGKKSKPLGTASTDVPVQHGDLGSGLTT